MRILWSFLLLAGCGRAPLEPPPPADHGPGFTRQHASAASDCATCHGPDPCARCHATRPPADHAPGFAGAGHALRAALDPPRCATCHSPGLCAGCH